METWAGLRWIIGPRDAGRALDAARDRGWAWSCVVHRRDDAAVLLAGAVRADFG
jgi:hypothetical protein